MSRVPTALVLSGGGAGGAYEVGVVKALASGASPATGYRPLEPEIFSGTSAGAYNCAFLAAGWERHGLDTAAQLERVWLDRLASRPGHGNGLFRLRADPLSLLDPRAYAPNPALPIVRFVGDSAVLGWDGFRRALHATFGHDHTLGERVADLINIGSFISSEPLTESIEATIDFEAFGRTRRQLRIIATNWQTGELRVFDNHDLAGGIGLQAIEASTALPGVFPPVEIGDGTYVDGGALLNTPLEPAIRAGADELHVVYLDPDISKIPIAHLRNTPSSFYRLIQIRWAYTATDDIGDAERITLGLELVRQFRQGRVTLDGEQMAKVAYEALQNLGSRSRFRPLVIHRYHPRDDLGGATGLLNMNRERLEMLIERGFHDAVDHDCERERCVLPAGTESGEEPIRATA